MTSHTTIAPMRTRAVFIVIAGSIGAFALALLITANILIDRFDSIEARQAADKAEQALNALAADLNQLAVSTRDYAEWDDAEDFIRTRDPQFLHANFSFDSLDGMQADVVVLLSAAGEVIFATQLDNDQHALAAVEPDLLATVRRELPRVPQLRRRPSIKRILAGPQGLLAFSIVEITRSDHSAPTGAALFFGRYLQTDEVVRARQASDASMTLTPLKSFAPTSSGWGNLQSWLRGESGLGSTDFEALDARKINGYALISDLDGTPAAVIAVQVNRNIGQLGRRTTSILVGALAALMLISGVTLLYMLRRLRREWHRKLSLKDLHQRVLSSLEEGVALVDLADNRFVEANDALLRCVDYSQRELRQFRLNDLYVDLKSAGDALIAAAHSQPNICRLRARDGQLIETELNAAILREFEHPMVCLVTRDLSQRRLAERQQRESDDRLAHLASHDALTGLPNRAYLLTRLPEMLRQAATEERSLALFYLDLDQFKNVNDVHGHGLGDQVIRIVASRLRDDQPGENLVVRMGGDEFVIVASCANDDDVRELVRNLLDCVRRNISVGSFSASFTASIGVSVYPADGLDAESLLKHADVALYQAKERGRDCHQAFASDMNIQISEHLALEQALRRAIGTAQISVHYQPIVDLHTGLLVSFEVLARWNHPERGPIPPGRFIPVAEKSGLIIPLGEHIVRDVIRQMRSWQCDGLVLAPIAINVAPIQFERTAFSTFVHETAARYDIDMQLLSFEVTESAWLQNSNKHVVMIDTLRHSGSRVYIDDFGTGFSNLSYLKTLPIDAVKIDQSFIRNIADDADDAAIVGGIITVARQLRLGTIAEGVETIEQAMRLRQLGCQNAQGYLFSKPLPSDQCRALLEQLGPARLLTDTVKVRAFRTVKTNQ